MRHRHIESMLAPSHRRSLLRGNALERTPVFFMSGHTDDVSGCEEIFRGRSRREVSRQSGVTQRFLVLGWFCNLFFSLLGHPRRKAVMCQQAHEVKLKTLRTELQRLHVRSHAYSFLLMRTWLALTFSLEKRKFFSDRFTKLASSKQ